MEWDFSNFRKMNIMAVTQIIPNLWFDTNAEEAVRFYVSVFKNGAIGRKTYFGKEGFEVHGMKEGTVMTIEFTIFGQQFVALNGGPVFKFNEAVSFIIPCDDQQEIDYYWNSLKQGGEESAQQCGWLKDKYGLSWQVVPKILDDYIADPDKQKSERVMHALLKMKKLDISELVAAYGTR